MTPLLDTLRTVWSAGGFVMGPLALTAAVLWWSLAQRLATLQRGSALPLEALVHQARGPQAPPPRGVIDTAAQAGAALLHEPPERLRARFALVEGTLRAELRRGARLCTSLVAVAPLCGLLGTVSGMIETFDSLASMALFSRSGGIAGGIAEALVSTQMGLSVAIPGALATRALGGRQQRLEQELHELTELLCGLARAPETP